MTAELRRLLAEATPVTLVYTLTHNSDSDVPYLIHTRGATVVADVASEPMAALIAAAVNALPALLDVAEKAQLPCNVLFSDDDAMRWSGLWVAIPKEDFAALRAALDRLGAS